jgi:hypothetical protein
MNFSNYATRERHTKRFVRCAKKKREEKVKKRKSEGENLIAKEK